MSARSLGSDAYGGYHSDMVNGYWNGHDSAAWGWNDRYGSDASLGWGLAAWGYGSGLYDWGYMPYSNPYYAVGTTGATARLQLRAAAQRRARAPSPR